MQGKGSDDIPNFNPHATLTRRKSWNHELSLKEIQQTEPLMEQIVALCKTSSGPWGSGVHLSCIFVMRRVQPLQQREHPMWEYAGPKDSSRTKADELSRHEFDSYIRAIVNLSGDDTPVLAASPLSSENPPTEVIPANVQFRFSSRVKFRYFLAFLI